jgi:adenylate/nucleoside-diphosphate kinase
MIEYCQPFPTKHIRFSNLSLQDEFEKVLIPIIPVNGARRIHIVQYVLNLKLKPLVENRASIFEKCYSVSTQLAQKMLACTYKYTSSFGYWDPVKVISANASESYVFCLLV